MEITEVNVHLVDGTNRLRANVSIVFDDCFAVRGIKIIEGHDGLFVAMPTDKRGRDVAHPIRNEFHLDLEDAIFGKYEEILRKNTTPDPDQIEYGR